MSKNLEPHAVKDVPWSTMNPRDKGPRWVVVAVDNVAAGWSDISREPNLEAYISLYVFDAWRVFRWCSPERLFQLYDCGNVAFCKEDTPEDERERIYVEWEVDVEPSHPAVSVSDMEAGLWGTVVRLYPDDGKCPDGEGVEYRKYMDVMVEHVVCNPPLLPGAEKRDYGWKRANRLLKNSPRARQATS